MSIRVASLFLCVLIIEAGTLPILNSEQPSSATSSGKPVYEFEVDIDKTVKPEPDSNEDYTKTYHGESTKTEDKDNKADGRYTSKSNVSVDHSSHHISNTKHSNNDLGPQKKTKFEDVANKQYTGNLDSTTVKDNDTLKKHTFISGQTDMDIYGSINKQSIDGGSFTTSDTTSNRSKVDRKTIARDFESHPDADNVSAYRRNEDELNSKASTAHSTSTLYTHSTGDNSVSVSNKNNVVNNQDYQTKYSTLKTLKSGPNEYNASASRITTTRSVDDTVKSQTTDITHQTASSAVNITDYNQQETKGEKLNSNNESVKVVSDKKGTVTSEHQKQTKEKLESSQKTLNYLTVETDPKDGFSTPLTVNISAETLNNKHVKTTEKNEKDIEKKTPDSKKNEHYYEVRNKQYAYETVPRNEKPDSTKEDQKSKESEDQENSQSKDQKPQESAKAQDQQTQEQSTQKNQESPNQQPSQQIVPQNNDSQKQLKPTDQSQQQSSDQPQPTTNTQQNNNNQGATVSALQTPTPIPAKVVLLLPTSLANGDKNLLDSPQKFIAASLTSSRISNFLDYIKNNGIATDAVLIGPIDDVTSEDVQDLATNHNTKLGVAIVSNDYDMTNILTFSPENQQQDESADKDGQKSNSNGTDQSKSEKPVDSNQGETTVVATADNSSSKATTQ